MGFWETIKRDVQQGLTEGMTVVREGATLVQKRAGELTVEGKRQYLLFELKNKVKAEMAELGGRVYSASKRVKNPILDPKVKATLARIDRLEKRVAAAEKQAAPVPKPPQSARKPAPRRSRPAAGPPGNNPRRRAVAGKGPHSRQ